MKKCKWKILLCAFLITVPGLLQNVFSAGVHCSRLSHSRFDFEGFVEISNAAFTRIAERRAVPRDGVWWAREWVAAKQLTDLLNVVSKEHIAMLRSRRDCGGVLVFPHRVPRFAAARC